MTIPTKDVSSEVFLVGSRSLTTGALTTVAVAASGLYVQAGSGVTAQTPLPITAGIVDVTTARQMAVWLAVNGVASDIGSISLLVLLSASPQITVSGVSAPPTSIMDVWYPAGVTDGSVTSTALLGAMPASQVLTAPPAWGVQTMYPMNLITPILVNSTDRQRMKISVDTTGARWMQILYAKSADQTHLTTIALSISQAC